MSGGPLLEIVDPGLLATVQDLGRMRCGEIGVSPSGPADWLSARCANRLVGNPREAALIETTMTGLQFKARQGMIVAVTGATAQLAVAGEEKPLWQSVRVHGSAEVTIGPADRGLRCYVAFYGGIDVKPVLGSASTDLGAGFGGFGRALGRGDVLSLHPVEGEPPDGERTIPSWARPAWRQPTILRVLPGPHAVQFSAQDLEGICARPYRVSARSNRQGLRLDGLPLRGQGGFDVLSSGVCAGCVQFTSEGLPVVLLAEHQTTGGYAVPIVVIAADLPDAAQLRPGDEVRFTSVTPVEASLALVEKSRALSEAL